jgi:hypothetical protein
VLEVSVGFAESTLGNNNQEKTLLFCGVGLILVKQFLDLTQVVAVSTPSSSPTASSQANLTHRFPIYNYFFFHLLKFQIIGIRS